MLAARQIASARIGNSKQRSPVDPARAGGRPFAGDEGHDLVRGPRPRGDQLLIGFWPDERALSLIIVALLARAARISVPSLVKP